jgi:integrase
LSYAPKRGFANLSANRFVANRSPTAIVPRVGYSTRKPFPSFPLTPRKDGRFAKKIKGVYYTFGSNGDWRAAKDEYLKVADAVDKGRSLPQEIPDAITVRQCANRYLANREKEVGAGTLSLGSWDNYRKALTRFARFVGPTCRMVDLKPDDFTRFAIHLREKAELGSYAFNRARSLISAWLRYAAREEWIHPVNMGNGFRKVPAGKMRADRKPRLLTPGMVKGILGVAGPQMRAMILLGLNGGFGATDCANLPRTAVDLDAAVIRFPRTKTGLPRTVPLWPETVAALRIVLAMRPADPLVFRTNHGLPWVRVTRKGKTITTKDSVGFEFYKILAKLWMKDQFRGVGFYVCRHTHATYANEIRDSDARLHLMGRKLPGIDSDTYLEGIFLPRLKKVTAHIRKRLLIA